eukprot:169895_1
MPRREDRYRPPTDSSSECDSDEHSEAKIRHSSSRSTRVDNGSNKTTHNPRHSSKECKSKTDRHSKSSSKKSHSSRKPYYMKPSSMSSPKQVVGPSESSTHEYSKHEKSNDKSKNPPKHVSKSSSIRTEIYSSNNPESDNYSWKHSASSSSRKSAHGKLKEVSNESPNHLSKSSLKRTEKSCHHKSDSAPKQSTKSSKKSLHTSKRDHIIHSISKKSNRSGSTVHPVKREKSVQRIKLEKTKRSRRFSVSPERKSTHKTRKRSSRTIDIISPDRISSASESESPIRISDLESVDTASLSSTRSCKGFRREELRLRDLCLGALAKKSSTNSAESKTAPPPPPTTAEIPPPLPLPEPPPLEKPAEAPPPLPNEAKADSIKIVFKGKPPPLPSRFGIPPPLPGKTASQPTIGTIDALFSIEKKSNRRRKSKWGRLQSSSQSPFSKKRRTKRSHSRSNGSRRRKSSRSHSRRRKSSRSRIRRRSLSPHRSAHKHRRSRSRSRSRQRARIRSRSRSNHRSFKRRRSYSPIRSRKYWWRRTRSRSRGRYNSHRSRSSSDDRFVVDKDGKKRRKRTWMNGPQTLIFDSSGASSLADQLLASMGLNSVGVGGGLGSSLTGQPSAAQVALAAAKNTARRDLISAAVRKAMDIKSGKRLPGSRFLKDFPLLGGETPLKDRPVAFTLSHVQTKDDILYEGDTEIGDVATGETGNFVIHVYYIFKTVVQTTSLEQKSQGQRKTVSLKPHQKRLLRNHRRPKVLKRPADLWRMAKLLRSRKSSQNWMNLAFRSRHSEAKSPKNVWVSLPGALVML